MEKWDGTVLDICATVDKLGETSVASCPACTLCHAVTVSYPYGKGKKSALNLKVLMNNDIDGLQYLVGEPDISQGQPVIQRRLITLNTARYKMYMSRKKPPPLKKLPPTDSNLQLMNDL